MQENPLIKDLEKLFRYSGMIDQLRDTSKVLHEQGNVSRDTVTGMAQQYAMLREALKNTINGTVSEEMNHWCPDIDPDTVSVDGIFFAAAKLARWIDLVHQTPKFLVAEELAGAAAVEMTAKAKATVAHVEGVPAEKRPGTYL
jgi:hypothetical protein